MKTELTPEQEKAIYSRDSNILVSAAAGSGKTKVLVDRIIGKITDKDNPVNVDEFLVVTFTKAAATQMKEKIARKLAEALNDKPESEHLLRQQMLVNRADITTIDSFCLKVVKENINRLDIDTSFSIGDNGMLELIKGDVINKLFDECYGREKSEDDFVSFTDLVDIFDEGKSDENLKKTILNIYRKASGYPRPKEWLNRAKEALMVDDVKDFEAIPWIRPLVSEIKSNVRVAMGIADLALNLCFLDGGPDNNIETIEKDKSQMEQILSMDDYETICKNISITWARQIKCSSEIYDSDIVKQFQKYRTRYKDIFKIISKLCSGPEAIINENKILRTYLIPLIDLVIEFIDCYKEEKKQKKVLDFSDISYFAYELLVNGFDENGNIIPSKIAKDISADYKEVFIDEYQDSNYLQEYILTAVSGMHRDDYNMFMVGDIKQSIYRFRMARPDLFINKYNKYSEDGKECRIELNKNFRSRDVVLLPVNYFFYQLMGEDLGGITYDEKISLVPRKYFPDIEDNEKKNRISSKTELLTVDVDSDDDYESENITNLELEAHLVAKRILELVDSNKGMLVYDEDSNTYRNAQFKDIVILSRSLKKIGDIFYNILGSYGIPVYLEDSKGYFNAVEIKVLISLLSVVDNSRQDIPLSAALLSPMADINESELAVICDYCKSGNQKYLYDKCVLYMLDNEDDISYKLKTFFDLLDELKEKKKTFSISDLIWLALEKTNYYTYVSAMPMGHKRRANIDMLIEKADSFEDGYYKGLFNFLRYVEKLKVNDVDFGEASVVGKDEDVVRILTMHASKGLEYPIVFVSALGKKFNEEEYKDKVIVHGDYYITAPIINIQQRYIMDSISREMMMGLGKTEAIEEELRILYVAMTRAKEKLILTGVHKDYDRFLEEYAYLLKEDKLLIPYNLRRNTHSFLDLILKAMIRYNMLAGQLEVDDMIDHIVYTKAQVIGHISDMIVENRESIENIFSNVDDEYDVGLYDEYKEKFQKEYKYKFLTTMRSKMSISDIKKQKAYDGAGYDDSEFEFSEEYGTGADTKKDNKANKFNGAERGTIIHKYMELVPFEKLVEVNDYHTFCKDFLEELKKKEVFSEDEANVVDLCKLKNFFECSLGQRMIKAAANGMLVKEQQFSVGIPVSEIQACDKIDSQDLDDIVIVQGIIDAFFYEEGEIVVMDYKTDRADEDTLLGRYRAQLDYYGDTVSRITGKKLKEKIIYSFDLGKEIML